MKDKHKILQKLETAPDSQVIRSHGVLVSQNQAARVS